MRTARNMHFGAVEYVASTKNSTCITTESHLAILMIVTLHLMQQLVG